MFPVLTHIFSYGFGVLLCMLSASMGEHAEAIWADREVYAGSSAQGMVTMFQVITLENWVAVVGRPMMELSPFTLLLLLFVILFCSFGLLNVIVAVIVERTLDVKEQNKASVAKVVLECEKIIIDSMGSDFLQFAKDVGGHDNRELSFEQFVRALEDHRFRRKLDLLGLPIEDIEELFFLLDVDSSQSISVEEFLSGVPKMFGSAHGIDLVELLSFVGKANVTAERIITEADLLLLQADVLFDKIEDMSGIMKSELHQREYLTNRKMELSDLVSRRNDAIQKVERSHNLRGLRSNSVGRMGNKFDLDLDGALLGAQARSEATNTTEESGNNAADRTTRV